MASKSSVENGSSPRMRGTANTTARVLTIYRFIPAYAGNRFRKKMSRNQRSVHPRVCGEQNTTGAPSFGVNGSSPRMRGTVLRPFVALVSSRFIPAYAGNRIERRRRGREKPVHPRVCGEQLSVTVPSLPHFGSSPRMRGTVYRGRRGHLRARFIPAYAGNSREGTKLSGDTSVHPRVCGEQKGNTLPLFPDDGSSPRMRGTEMSSPRAIRNPRFIPAYAGNSLPVAC